MRRIIQILKERGPMLSGELAVCLQNRHGISNESARKIISRSAAPISKMRNISFERNQKYIYLQEQYNTEQYFRNLFNAFKSSSKNYYQILLAIQSNGGFISKGVLANYSSAPVENLTRHTRYDLILKRLIELDFISEELDGYYQLLYPQSVKDDLKNTKAIELAKKTVIQDFCDWLKKINFIAYNSDKGFYHQANFAKFQWSFTAPSYINDIADRKNNNPGFWIGDICIGKSAGIGDVQFFVDKVDIIKTFRNIKRFIPVFIADNFTKEAHKLLKEKGIVCAKIGNLFSDTYADTLRELASIVKNTAAIISNEPEKFVDYINRVSLLEGKMGNLVGDLFESSVGYYFSRIGCNYFELNKIARYENIQKEIDVYVIRDGKIKIVECKGIKSPLDHEYVKKWLSDNVPAIYKSLKQQNSEAVIEFEIWSVGGFIDESLDILRKAKAQTKKYSIDFFDASEIMKRAKEAKCDILLKSIESILQDSKIDMYD